MIYRKSENIQNPRPYSILIPYSRTDIACYRRLAGHVNYWLEQNIGEKKKDWALKVYYGSKRDGYEGISVKFSTEEDAMAFMLAWS